MRIRSFEDFLRKKGITSPDYIILYTSTGRYDSRLMLYEHMPRDDIQVIALHYESALSDRQDAIIPWTGDDYFYLPGDKESRAGRLLPWLEFEAILKEATLE